MTGRDQPPRAGGKNGLVELLFAALPLVVGAEVEARCGAGNGERSSERVNSRNGNRERLLEELNNVLTRGGL